MVVGMGIGLLSLLRVFLFRPPRTKVMISQPLYSLDRQQQQPSSLTIVVEGGKETSADRVPSSYPDPLPGREAAVEYVRSFCNGKFRHRAPDDDHRGPLSFLHIPKTGGTSVELIKGRRQRGGYGNDTSSSPPSPLPMLLHWGMCAFVGNKVTMRLCPRGEDEPADFLLEQDRFALSRGGGGAPQGKWVGKQRWPHHWWHTPRRT